MKERQIHKALAWMKEKFLNKDGTPKQDAPKAAVEHILNIEMALSEEARRESLPEIADTVTEKNVEDQKINQDDHRFEGDFFSHKSITSDEMKKLGLVDKFEEKNKVLKMMPPAGKSKLDILPSWKRLPAKEKLAVLLNHSPGLADKLIEALETDRFFVTISCQKKRRPEDPNDLQHFYQRTGYALNDVLPSLKHIAADFAAKEMPNAELGASGWH